MKSTRFGMRRLFCSFSKSRLRQVAALDLVEGSCEIVLEIVEVFETCRNPDQTVRNAERLTLSGRHRRVRHRRRMGDQRFDAAQTFSQCHQFHRIEEAPGRVERTKVEGQHATESA